MTCTSLAMIKGISVSDDGKRAELIIAGIGPAEIRLPFASNDLDRLTAAAAHAAGLAMRRRLDDQTILKILPIESWEVRPHYADGVVVTLCLPDQLHLSFILDCGAAGDFAAAVSCCAAEPDAETPLVN